MIDHFEFEKQWSQAFARQACSDFEARDVLLNNAILPQCHQLHYLQMAMEKAAKAHLIGSGAEPTSVQGSHAYIAKVIPIIVMNGLSRTGGKKDGWLMKAVHALAKRISCLHPQINADAVPSNCEYPWNDARGNIIAPADHDFEKSFHKVPAAITMIKEVRTRVVELAGQ
ncbi:MAG: hypothetical protein H7210_11815 [Pyrinomonadaceae bacterium]|nr:hypothetical protein [Phycisphaerales bacterium]